jgi:hypothetical protein
MKVEGRPSIQGSFNARRADRTGERSGDFARMLDAGATKEGAATGGARPAGMVDPLLAIQEVDPDKSSRGRARKRGADILDRLDAIRLGLLDGALDVDGLDQLRALIAEERETVDDPRLAEVLAEIDLRAQVEIAKLDPDRVV